MLLFCFYLNSHNFSQFAFLLNFVTMQNTRRHAHITAYQHTNTLHTYFFHTLCGRYFFSSNNNNKNFFYICTNKHIKNETHKIFIYFLLHQLLVTFSRLLAFLQRLEHVLFCHNVFTFYFFCSLKLFLYLLSFILCWIRFHNFPGWKNWKELNERTDFVCKPPESKVETRMTKLKEKCK